MINNSDISNISGNPLQSMISIRSSVSLPGYSNLSVELELLNAINKRLEYNQQVNTWKAFDRHETESGSGTIVEFNVHQDIRDLGYISGKYNVTYRVFQNQIGDFAENRLSIQAFSTKRDEIRCIPVNYSNSATYGSFVQQFINFIDKDKEKVLAGLQLNFGNGVLYDVDDYTVDDITFPSSPHSIIFKLKSPIDTSLLINDTFWVTQQFESELNDTIVVIPPSEVDNFIQLRGPNFEAISKGRLSTSTAFKNTTDLINISGSDSLLSILSGSIDESYNIDFTSYDQFIHFSSAASRLYNFKYKLQLLELYDSRINAVTTNLTGLVSSSVSGSAINLSDAHIYTNKRREIINGFDEYERFMYYQSGSYVSNSFGEFDSMTWPKANNTLPYVNYPTTASAAITWFDGTMASASLYDTNNHNILRNILPAHIRENEEENNALLFIDLLGQQYDKLFNKVKHQMNIYSREDGVYDGIAKQYLFDIAASFGVNVDNGFKQTELWNALLNQDQSGSYYFSGSLPIISSNDISNEAWKRVINNLPYLLKTKGTTRGFKALLNCFGIPDNVLRIKEYDGPIFGSETGRNIEQVRYSPLHIDNRSGVNTEVAFTTPVYKTVELFFRPVDYRTQSGSHSSTVTQTIFEARRADGAGASTFSIHYDGSISGSYGTISATTLSAEIKVPIFDGAWNHIAITSNDDNSTGTIYVHKVERGRLTFAASSSYISKIPGGAGLFKLTNAQHYHGDLMELRLWRSRLTEDEIINHTHDPKSIYRHIPSTEDPSNILYGLSDLICRFRLGSDSMFGINSGSILYSDHPMTGSINLALKAAVTGSLVTGSRAFEDDHELYNTTLAQLWPNGIINRQINDKVRIDNSTLYNSTLSVTNTAEISNNLRDKFVDDNRLDIGFSPYGDISDRYVEVLGDFNLGELIGNPSDDYVDNYADLDEVRLELAKQFAGRQYKIWDYIRLITYYDRGLFQILKSFVPARANSHVGLIIEPTVLERSKVRKRKQESAQVVSYETSESISLNYTLESAYESIDTQISLDVVSTTGSYEYIQSNLAIPQITLTGSNESISVNISNTSCSVVGTYDTISGGDIDTRNIYGYDLRNGSRYFPSNLVQYNIVYPGLYTAIIANNVTSARRVTGWVINGYNRSIFSIEFPVLISPSHATVENVFTSIGFGTFTQGVDTVADYTFDPSDVNNIYGDITIDYIDMATTATLTPTYEYINNSLMPYWYSEAVSLQVTGSNPSTVRYASTRLYSSSISASIDRAYNEILSLAEVSDFNLDNTQMLNLKYNGCKITGPGFNINSTETIDKLPVVEIRIVDSKTIRPSTDMSTGNNLSIE